MRILTGSPSSRTPDVLWVASYTRPTPLDGLLYGFSGPDSQRLATVHIPTSAFEISATFNILDDAATIYLGLKNLPADQAFHPYVNVGMPNMKHALLPPMDWHAHLVRDFPYGIALKAFYNIFLVPLLATVGQP